MCEIHCPDDAMYVAPLRHTAPDSSVHLDLAALKARGYFGSFRHRLGWGQGLVPPSTDAELHAVATVGPRRLDQPDSDVKPRVIS
jgi:hypothetical protein